MIHLAMSNHEKYKYVKAWPKSIKGVQPSFNLSVRGDIYSVFLVPLATLNTSVDGAQACMHFEDKTIHFTVENLTITTITHELLHCFIASTYIHELVDLSKDDFEEIVCEVVSRNWQELGVMAKQVKQALETIKSSTEEDYVNKTNRAKKVSRGK